MAKSKSIVAIQSISLDGNYVLKAVIQTEVSYGTTTSDPFRSCSHYLDKQWLNAAILTFRAVCTPGKYIYQYLSFREALDLCLLTPLYLLPQKSRSVSVV